MLFSELVMTEGGSTLHPYWISQPLRRNGDHREWRVQRNTNHNYDGPDKWFVECYAGKGYGRYKIFRFQDDGLLTTCLAELGCWLTEFTPITPRGNDDHERSHEKAMG
jgi:hypothetical protein